MRTVRVIPCLDVADGRVVKGVNFVELKDQGDPLELSKIYSEQNADELIFLDITATLEGRATTTAMVADISKHLDIPFAVGGGVASVADAQKLFDAGVSKIGVNSAAVNNPGLVDELSEKFGKESIVVAIDIASSDVLESGFEVVTRGGKHKTGLDAVDWAKEVTSRGAGEILLTSMDADGTKDGYHLAPLRLIADAIPIPVIASGGAGELRHFVEAADAGAGAVLAASVFHNGVFSVSQVKNALRDAGFKVNEND